MPLSVIDSGDSELELLGADNGSIALTFLPAAGGRLISVFADGHEYLWRNPAFFDRSLKVVQARSTWPTDDGTFATWANLGGSKTWPAPQGWNGAGEWPGPPDPILDGGDWRADTSRDRSGAISIRMTSPDDARSGLRIERAFLIPATGHAFHQTTRFTNVSDTEISWSIWEVCQVDTSDGQGKPAKVAAIEIDVEDASPLIDLGTYRGSLTGGAPRDGRFTLPIQDAVAKLGFASASGRIAYRDPSGTLAITFEPVPGADYPDGGSRAEIWMQSPQVDPIEELSGLHPDAYLAELEVLSPRFTIAAGEFAEYKLDWTVTPHLQ
ncbi:MAG: hypothetical protein JWQ39_1608 [Glaciihabitans sp.]|nr:hypothetical protein [Glaciihabitans sp.]